MRAGVSVAQQTLSPEAASVLKHSLTLSRRRGHAQVTPLHVAATLLISPRTTLLKRACLKSQPQPHHHPLQCRALELCFNVALNRLPATPTPLLHPHQPSLSNALIAALKRAQAHQRRGCVEQQNQNQNPIVAVKVELEQLVLSILDDPSVSRVMREAGFSSTVVKENLEDNSTTSVFQCYNTNGGGIYSTPSSPPTLKDHHLVINPNSSSSSSFWQNPFLFSSPPHKKPVIINTDFNEDVKLVFEVMVRKRRNAVVLGDCLSVSEGIVSEIMRRVERGGSDVPDLLKSAHFIKFQFSSVPLKFMKREEVEMNISDLKRKVDSFVVSGSRGVIIYTGDLKWTVVDDDDDLKEGFGYYSPVDHLVSEMGKLISWYNNNNSSNGCSRVWLMATANYQTYMKCQMKKPSLDVQWSLQAVSVPSGGLGLSLNAAPTSGQDSRIQFPQNACQALDKSPFSVKEEQQDVLTCCPECKSNYEKEVAFKKSFPNKDLDNGLAQLPYWLKPHGIETIDKDELVQLRRKYNKLCHSLHQGSHNPNNPSSVISNQCFLGRNYNHYPSSYPSWPNKNSFLADSETISFAKPNQSPSSLPRFRRQQSCHIEFSFSNGSSKYQSLEPNLDSLKGIDDKEVKITLALGNSTYNDNGPIQEKNALNDIFQENVPWQSETIPSIVEALMDSSKEKLLLFQGNDLVGKRRLAAAIAKSMFGSSDLLFCMNMRKNNNTVTENCEMLKKAVRDHDQKLVVLVEDVDYADPEFVKFLVEEFEWDFGRAIFVLTMDGDTGYNKTRENMDRVIQMKLLVNDSTFGSGIIANLDHKRKCDWDLPIRSNKSTRKMVEMEEVSSDNTKRDFSRQLSSNSLDLNIEANEDVSPISSDLTREITTEQQSSVKFLEKIKNRFVLNRDSDQEERAREMFLTKFKKSFEEISGGGVNVRSSFEVEDKVLKEVLRGSGLYLNGLFEQWLKDVFKSGLRVNGIRGGDNGNVSVRLVLLGGKDESCCADEDGFMGTCLPKRIQVSLLG